MQSASSRIWTPVTVSISNDDNHYTMVTFCLFVFVCVCLCVFAGVCVFLHISSTPCLINFKNGWMTGIMIGIMVRVFANGLEDLGSILGRVIPKTQKIMLDAVLLNTQYYNVRIKSKWSNPRKGVVSSPTSWCCSYWKGNLSVFLDYGPPATYIYQLYIFIHTYIYIYNQLIHIYQ